MIKGTGGDFDDFDDWGAKGPQIPDSDWEAMDAACRALEGWAFLPKAQRDDPANKRAALLLDTAFALLESEPARERLAQRGAEMALSDDDDRALAGFIALGARFDPPAIPEPRLVRMPEDSQKSAKKSAKKSAEESSGTPLVVHGKTAEIARKLREHADDPESRSMPRYADAWRGSVLHECAQRRAWRCLSYLARSEIGPRDAAICEPLMRHPQPNPLREFGAAELLEVERARAKAMGLSGAAAEAAVEAAASANELILGLMEHMAEQTERSVQLVTVAETLQGNPFFVALRMAGDTERGAMDKRHGAPAQSEALAAMADLLALGLFDKESSAHRDALLSQCGPDAKLACALAARLGVHPGQGGAKAVENAFEEVALAGSLGKATAEYRQLCAPWTAGPGFADALMEQAIFQAQRRHESALRAAEGDGPKDTWAGMEAARAWEGVSNVFLARLDPERGYGEIGEALAKAAREAADGALVALPPSAPARLAKGLRASAEAMAQAELPRAPAPRL